MTLWTLADTTLCLLILLAVIILSILPRLGKHHPHKLPLSGCGIQSAYDESGVRTVHVEDAELIDEARRMYPKCEVTYGACTAFQPLERTK